MTLTIQPTPTSETTQQQIAQKPRLIAPSLHANGVRNNIDGKYAHSSQWTRFRSTQYRALPLLGERVASSK
jgi:hypothetical protein